MNEIDRWAHRERIDQIMPYPLKRRGPIGRRYHAWRTRRAMRARDRMIAKYRGFSE